MQHIVSLGTLVQYEAILMVALLPSMDAILLLKSWLKVDADPVHKYKCLPPASLRTIRYHKTYLLFGSVKLLQRL